MQVSLVVIVAAALVYFIGKEVFASFRHPSEEEMITYWNGSLEEQNRKAYRATSEHLASCEQCRELLDKVRKENAGPGADAPMIERKY